MKTYRIATIPGDGIGQEVIPAGQQVVVKWRGQPLFIRHRTPAEIASAKAVDVAALPDAIKAMHPWVRSVGALQDAMSRQQSLIDSKTNAT